MKTDYKNFRLSKLSSPEYKHLKLLLFWPVFMIVFSLLEKAPWIHRFHTVECAWDSAIPFCEVFIIPYLLWHLYIPLMLLWLLLHDTIGFSQMMRFIILTYGITLLVYLVYPTCQHLRPLNFDRDNILIRCVALQYKTDTNTNVCPSIHVLGSLAVIFASWNSVFVRRHKGWFGITVLGILIAISTVFIKQHSVIDVFAGLLLGAIAYPFIYLTSSKAVVSVKRTPSSVI